jgi:hypothetical protein
MLSTVDPTFLAVMLAHRRVELHSLVLDNSTIWSLMVDVT